MAVEHISQSSLDQTVSGTEVVLVDFFATWCNPCKILAPVLDQISESLPANRKIVKIDIDENMEAARRYGVMSIPTLILFKNGQAVQRLVGVRPEDEIRDLLK